MLKFISLACVLAVACARPQDAPQWTAAQQLSLQQFAAIEAANAPSPVAAVPGFAEWQAQQAAHLLASGIDVGAQAHEQAEALVLQQQQELALIQ